MAADRPSGESELCPRCSFSPAGKTRLNGAEGLAGCVITNFTVKHSQ